MFESLLNTRMPSATVSTIWFVGLLWSFMVFLTWLSVGSLSFNLWVINNIFLTQREVVSILQYKDGVIDFQQAFRLINKRNPTLSYEQINSLLR